MSVNDNNSSSSDTLTAEFRDGRLQIVEYSTAAGEGEQEDQVGTEDVDTDYIHIVNDNDNQGWQLSNLNFTLARCDEQNDEGEYAIIEDDSEQLPQEFVLKSNSDYSVQQEIRSEMEDDGSSYVIMFNPDADDDEDEYVVLEDEHRSGTGTDSYVVVHGKEGPMVFLQSQLQITQQPPEPTTPKKAIPTALELLKKAKAVKKAKALLQTTLHSAGRGYASGVPSAEQLLESPDFKIYLYSCKLCPFQCNQIKQMTAHKAKEHLKKRSNTKTRYPYKNCLNGGRSMQCARCPYRATVISDLLNHVKVTHPEEDPQKKALACQLCGVQSTTVQDGVESCNCTQSRVKEEEPANAPTDSFTCQLCGEQSSSQWNLDKHTEDQHPLSFIVIKEDASAQ